jgi:small subunit ribosomal protein S1
MSDEETLPADAEDRPKVRRRTRKDEEGEEGSAPAAEASADAPEAAPEPIQVVVRSVPHPSEVQALDSLLASSPEILGDEAQAGSALDAPDLADAAAVAAELDMDFAAMLEAEGGMQQFKPGDRVAGRVSSITDNEVYVDIGAKADAWVNRREVSDPAGNLKFAVGDDIKAQVVQVGDDIRLSYGALQANLLTEQLGEAADSGMPVEGRVDGFNEGGLEVRIGTRRAFCPRSQIDRGFVNEDLSVYVGRKFRFLVTKFDPTGKNLKISRRALMEREAKEMAKGTRESLQVGALMDGTVRKVMPFGVFVDLGGVDGLVHVSEISWERVEDPATVVKEGDPVRVKVLKIDGKRDRIGLSMKQAAGDPWKAVKDNFEPGKTYPGKVTRLADFGAFVSVAPGLEGLVHISEFDWTKRIGHPREMLKVDQEIEVAVVEVDKKKRRLALSIKQAGEDPWGAGAEEVKVGDKIKVTVEKVAEFGVFAIVTPGVTGLVPNSHMNTPRGTNHSRSFKPGTEFEVQVIDIDRKKRKITLSRKALADGGAKEDFNAYKKALKKEQSSGESAFALAFKAAQGRSKN